MAGGHSAAANLQESARRIALEYVYMSRQLVGDREPVPAGQLGGR